MKLFLRTIRLRLLQTTVFSLLSFSALAQGYNYQYRVPEVLKPCCTEADSLALQAYYDASNVYMRDLFLTTEADSVAAAARIRHFEVIADSVLKVMPCSAVCKDYITFWSKVNGYTCIYSMRFQKRIGQRQVIFTRDELKAMVDHRYAGEFNHCNSIANGFLPRKASFDERRDFAKGFFLNPEILGHVLRHIDDQEEKYILSQAGRAFPTDIEMKDADGKVVSFSEFKGKYVYIDFWASWCKPCCEEVPHLHKLAQKLTNDNVRILSISLDSTYEPWIKAMKRLGIKHQNGIGDCHGITEWLEEKSETGKAIGFSAIPFFAIYDPDGKLLVHDATRPSDPKTLELLQDLGK